MSLTKTLVGELLNSLKNNDGEEKIAVIIERLEALEANAKKNIIEEDVLQRAEKYNSINYNIHLNNNRYKMKPLSVMVEPYTYKTILVPVEQYVCCSAADQDESNCCNKPCDSCPYATGIVPKGKKDSDATFVVDPAPAPSQQGSVSGSKTSKTRTSTNQKKDACLNCNCERAKNITLDIEDIIENNYMTI